MAPSASDIARLRRLVNEPTTDTYSDDDLSAAIARYPLVDAWGNDPLVWNYAVPPALVANPLWTEGYDLHAAACEIWEEKAAVVAQDYDFTAPLDDGTYRRSQVYEQYMKQARRHAARRNPRALKTVVSPPPQPLTIYGNVWNDIDYPPEWGW